MERCGVARGMFFFLRHTWTPRLIYTLSDTVPLGESIPAPSVLYATNETDFIQVRCIFNNDRDGWLERTECDYITVEIRLG